MESMGLLALLLAPVLNVPFVPQEKDACAAASLAMVFRYWNTSIGEGEIKGTLLDPELHGIKGSKLAQFARDRGFQAIAYEGDLTQLRDFVAKGRPLIVAWQVGRKDFHDVVVVGFDEGQDAVLVNDPA